MVCGLRRAFCDLSLRSALDPLLFSGVLIHRAALGAGSNHSHAPPILGNGLPCLIVPRYHRLIGESRDVLKFSLASAAGDELRATRKTTDTSLPPNPSLTFDEGNVITKPVPVVSTASSRIVPRFDCDHKLGIYFLVFQRPRSHTVVALQVLYLILHEYELTGFFGDMSPGCAVIYRVSPSLPLTRYPGPLFVKISKFLWPQTWRRVTGILSQTAREVWEHWSDWYVINTYAVLTIY